MRCLSQVLRLEGLGDAISSNYLPKHLGALSRLSFECLVVHSYQAEVTAVSIVPLEVVCERPDEIAPDVSTLLDDSMNLL